MGDGMDLHGPLASKGRCPARIAVLTFKRRGDFGHRASLKSEN